jgi:transcriptional regulator GlxA family with amidase domain
MDEQPHEPLEVAILAFPQATASVTHGMYDLFASAGRDWDLVVTGVPGPGVLRPRIVSRLSGSFPAANGVPLTGQMTLEEAHGAAVVCVPEIAVAPGQSLEGLFDAEIAYLQQRYAQGAVLATACSGALLLAEAGLLAGQEATTHWAYCDVLARRYSGVKVHAQRALVTSGDGQRLVMAGGGSSWLDLCLYLIARIGGIECAMRTARVNLIDWHDVGQQPFARLAHSRQTDDQVIARCQAWIAEHYCEPSPVAAMVDVSGLPERSFKRRFQQATGMSPLEYVHVLRMEEAKQMLEAGDAPVEAIAQEVGYEDAAFFSRLFRRHVNLTPAQYRQRFGGLRKALQNPGV